MHLDGSAVDTLGIDSLDEPLLHSEGTSGGAPTVKTDDGGTDAGQVQFRDLIQQGVLQYIPAWSTTAAARVASDDPGDPSPAESSALPDSGSGDNSPGTPDDDSAGDSAADDNSGSDARSQADPDPALGTLSFAGHTIANVFTAAQGFERRWDACSSTPFLRSAGARQVVAYDDPQSLEMKATFARYAGLRGVNLFDIHGDTDEADLADALRRGLGL